MKPGTVLAASTRRFGRSVPVRSDERLSSADYLVAMARIYRNGGHAAHAAERVAEGLRGHLALKAGLRPKAPAEEVRRALERQGRHRPARSVLETLRT